MSWTNDIILEFIELYRQEQLLWDPRHPLHRNRSEVNDAWLRIQSSLCISCSITDLKKKKESLMTQFRMHNNKKKRSPDVLYRTTWFAYSLMDSFLGGKYECDNETSTNNLEQEFFSSSPLYTESPVIEHQYTPRSAIAAERLNSNKPKSSTHTKINDVKSKSFNSESSYTKRQTDQMKATGEKKDMDEYDLYGQLLVKKLRKLDEHQRDVAMHEIDNIMFRAKMQSTPQSRSYPSSPSPVPRKVKSPLFIVAQQTHTQYEDENIYQQDPMQTQPSS